MLFLVSCDLFLTRDPEEPKLSRNSFKSPLTPEILFENLENSFSQKNNESYKSCFVENTFLSLPFKFVPSSTAAVSDPALLSWDLQKEFQYFFNLTKSDANNSISLELENEVWNTVDEKRIYKYDYVITISGSIGTSQYLGASQFEIQLDQRNQWVIVEWRDIQTGADLTWSDLKGAYY